MKKQFYLLGLLFFPYFLLAQNVGIGTTTPTARLQINHHSSTSLSLALVDSAENFSGRMEFRNNNNTRRMMISGFAASNFSNGQYLDIHSDSVYPATFKGNGNVGIRNLDPQYTLDVGGDINTTGAIRTNGNGGTSGQVLQNNGNGTMSWVDITEFKNYITFRTVGSSTWTVPAGVTRIWVEAWAGGGGASQNGGGGGGGYVTAIFTVTPAGTVNYTVGDGGAGAAPSGILGLGSSVSFGAVTIVAFGGGGDNSGSTQTVASGGGFNGSTGTGYYGCVGEQGGSNQYNGYQINATTFRENQTGGKGGNGGNTSNTGGKGASVSRDASTLIAIYNVFGGNGILPGGGGGSWGTWGGIFRNGAQGLVIIHY